MTDEISRQAQTIKAAAWLRVTDEGSKHWFNVGVIGGHCRERGPAIILTPKSPGGGAPWVSGGVTQQPKRLWADGSGWRRWA